MILAATGLKREAGIIAGVEVRAVAGGGRAEGLEAALEALAPGAEALISLGLGGALTGGLEPGDWVVADAVRFDGTSFVTDPAWTAQIAARLPGARRGVLLGTEAMITDGDAKRAAHSATGALAVDMESQVAARVARKFGLPFAAARVMSDGARRDLPDAVKVGIRPDGGMAVGAVLAALAREPGQLPALIRTALDAERAFRALRDGRRLLGPRLGVPDLGQLGLDMG